MVNLQYLDSEEKDIVQDYLDDFVSDPTFSDQLVFLPNDVILRGPNFEMLENFSNGVLVSN